MISTSSQLRRACVAVLTGVALAGAAPQAASAHDSLTLRFQKECHPDATCAGTLLNAHGKPIRDSLVSALIDPLAWNAAAWRASPRLRRSRRAAARSR